MVSRNNTPICLRWRPKTKQVVLDDEEVAVEDENNRQIKKKQTAQTATAKKIQNQLYSLVMTCQAKYETKHLFSFPFLIDIDINYRLTLSCRKKNGQNRKAENEGKKQSAIQTDS